jgi:hypothetical protein
MAVVWRGVVVFEKAELVAAWLSVLNWLDSRDGQEWAVSEVQKPRLGGATEMRRVSSVVQQAKWCERVEEAVEDGEGVDMGEQGL